MSSEGRLRKRLVLSHARAQRLVVGQLNSVVRSEQALSAIDADQSYDAWEVLLDLIKAARDRGEVCVYQFDQLAEGLEFLGNEQIWVHGRRVVVGLLMEGEFRPCFVQGPLSEDLVFEAILNFPDAVYFADLVLDKFYILSIVLDDPTDGDFVEVECFGPDARFCDCLKDRDLSSQI